MDADELPDAITTEYKDILRSLAREYDVPAIDLHELITEQLGNDVPDYESFLDNCHLRPHVYEALGEAIVAALREQGGDKFDLKEENLEITDEALYVGSRHSLFRFDRDGTFVGDCLASFWNGSIHAFMVAEDRLWAAGTAMAETGERAVVTAVSLDGGLGVDRVFEDHEPAEEAGE